MEPAGQHPPDTYWTRRAIVAAAARGPGQPPADVRYEPEEDATFAAVVERLLPAWDRHAAGPALEGLARLSLDRGRVPQLREVNERLRRCSRFRFEAVEGLVPKQQFFAALARERFLSTQYVRWAGSPHYTPEPDVIHEVIGHGHLLAVPELAGLHCSAGAAMVRAASAASQQFVADVFWFSGEFGVVREGSTWKAYGAGLLSSVGELCGFEQQARIVPLDVRAMGTLPYDIARYQPVLFGAESMEEVQALVGTFFDTCTDESIAELRAA